MRRCDRFEIPKAVRGGPEHIGIILRRVFAQIARNYLSQGGGSIVQDHSGGALATSGLRIFRRGKKA